MTAVTFTREELYNRIWSTPARQLAKELGISDVGLAKVCRRYKIPKPPVGYWARVRHGNAPKKAPLPTGKDLPPLPIAIRGHLERVVAVHPEVREALEAALSTRPIKVPKQLRSPRPLVAHTRRALQDGRPDDRGLVSPKTLDALDVTVAPKMVSRAMSIMNALMIRLGELGFSVSVRDGRSNVCVCGEEIEFSLSEETNREERPPTESERWWSEHSQWAKDRKYYVLKPSGRLLLEVYAGGHLGRRRRWRDGTRQRVEDLIPKFIVGIVETAGATKTRREEIEAREREWRRQAELRELKREEIACERARRDALLEDSEAWHKASKLREYLAVLEDAVRGGELKEVYGRGPDAGLRWVREQVDHLDPLRPLREAHPES
jgi:hypothetical protein